MNRQQVSIAADVALGTLLLLLTLVVVVGTRATGLREAIEFLVKLMMPITGLLLIIRAAVSPSGPAV
ncbi:MAG: hypothetical protein KA190_09150 [Kofleriaceae bacterium]|nr:hypothetical protein [Kofleriaceae bacterium]